MQTILLGIVVLLVALVLLALSAVLKQQGRMLLRLEHLEERLGTSAEPDAPSPADVHEGQAGVGDVLEPFEIPDLAGQLISSADFRGERLLLVNWDPKCTFCDLVAHDLASLEDPLRRHGVHLLLVSRGDLDRNRQLAAEYGLECPILLQDDSHMVTVLRGAPTPVAYLLDGERRVIQPLAVGAEQVPDLAREALGADPTQPRLRGQRPLSESRIERNGLRPGSPAPPFELPDLHGGTVSLGAYYGRPLLLVFSDPGCGPCDNLASDLVRLHTALPDDPLPIVIVSRGELTENRQKVAQHGLPFPVLLQDRWSLSRKYGIFSTPVAFLLDSEGIIARPVAKGVDEILQLARSAVPVPAPAAGHAAAR